MSVYGHADPRPPAVMLMGPTASGKTDLAVQLVSRLRAEIISVDSAMVYRAMDIGTAKPSAEVLAQAPHRLIDVVEPCDAYSAARFREDALREMADVSARGHVPLLVGGTMLYFRALQYGLASMPAADSAVRARLLAEANEHGWAVLHRRLADIDADAAVRIHPNDPQRIQRALEVFEISGRTMSEWRAENSEVAVPYRLVKLALIPSDRQVLRERIQARFDTMLARGLVDEVEALRGRGDLHADLPSMRAVGYRQVWEFLEGNYSYDDTIKRGVAATRQLAKRQLTWLRSETQCPVFDSLDDQVTARVYDHLKALGI